MPLHRTPLKQKNKASTVILVGGWWGLEIDQRLQSFWGFPWILNFVWLRAWKSQSIWATSASVFEKTSGTYSCNSPPLPARRQNRFLQFPAYFCELPRFPALLRIPAICRVSGHHCCRFLSPTIFCFSSDLLRFLAIRCCLCATVSEFLAIRCDFL